MKNGKCKNGCRRSLTPRSSLLVPRQNLHAILNEPAYFTELGSAGASNPFEDRRFRCYQDRASPFHAAKRVIMVNAVPAGNGIGSDVDAFALGQKIQSRLKHANVRLHAGEKDLDTSVAIKGIGQLRSGTTTERGLFADVVQPFFEFGNGGAETFGILPGS